MRYHLGSHRAFFVFSSIVAWLFAFRQRVNRGFEVFGHETPWASLALIDNLSVDADQVEPVRMGAVSGVDSVIHGVDQRRQIDVERLAHLLANLRPLKQSLGLFDSDALALVSSRRSITTGRMGLSNVDHKELHIIAVVFVHFIQNASLASEGGSRIRAEDEGDRLVSLKIA